MPVAQKRWSKAFVLTKTPSVFVRTSNTASQVFILSKPHNQPNKETP